MSSAGNGLSGPALGALSIGVLLVYAGFRGVSPLQALRDVSSGKPPSVKNEGGSFPLGNPIGNAANIISGIAKETPFGIAVASAAESFKGDQYSQAKRGTVGFSDCSSFAAKSFIAVGVKGISKYWTTLVFRASPLFQVIDTSQASAGDIIITSLKTLSGAHMAVVVRPGYAIGQQNPSSNVQEGPFSQIMAGKSSYIAMRYIGPLPAQFDGMSSAERKVN